MRILVQTATMGLLSLLLVPAALGECIQEQKRHCAGLYNKRGIDKFRVDQAVRGRPRIEADLESSKSSVVVDDVDGRTVRVRWNVQRYSCIRYDISVCW